MEHLKIKSFGPIDEADVHFGDLTLLVLIDKNNIRKTLEQYSIIWGKDADKILDLYFGEGMIISLMAVVSMMVFIMLLISV